MGINWHNLVRGGWALCVLLMHQHLRGVFIIISTRVHCNLKVVGETRLMLYGDARVKSLLFKNINFEYKELGKFIYNDFFHKGLKKKKKKTTLNENIVKCISTIFLLLYCTFPSKFYFTSS